MIGFGNSDWSYDPFEKMVIFPPDPLLITEDKWNGEQELYVAGQSEHI